MNTDIIIVGKGIAGLVLSFLLKQKGIDHVVLDRRGGINDFALAETLPPSALPLLQKLGIVELFENTAVQRMYGYHSLWGRNTVTDDNFYFHRPYQYGLKINKQAVIREFEKQQKEYIVRFERNVVIQPDDAGITLTCEQNCQTNTIRGKFIVDATGRSRAILKKLHIPSIDYDTLIAFSCHLPRIQHPALTHSVYIEAFEEGWGIVSGLNQKENVMTLFTHKENSIQPRLKNYKNWASILSGTTYLRDFLPIETNIRVKGGKANSSKAQSFSGKNWLALGDAAMCFDPLSSHGITNAIYTAQKAAIAIELSIKHSNEDGFKEYGESLSAIFMHYLRTKNQLYRNEQRWSEASFWKSRHFTEEFA